MVKGTVIAIAALAVSVCAQAQVVKRPIIIRPPVLTQPTTAPQRTPAIKKAITPIQLATFSNVPPITLWAATANNSGRTEVRLRWMVTEGWIPDGASFNVYKVVNGVRSGPLNPAPLAPDERKLGSGTNTALSRMATTALSNPLLLAFRTAKQNPPNVDRKALFSFKKGALPVTLAGPTFKVLKSQLAQLAAAKHEVFLPVNQALQAAIDSPSVAGYAGKLGLTTMAKLKALQQMQPSFARPGVTPVRTGALQPSTNRLSSVQTLRTTPAAPPAMHTMMATTDLTKPIRDARTMMAIGALTSTAVADSLGVAFTDTQVQSGQAVQYVLSLVQPGVQPADISTAQITVGSDMQPPTPTGLDGAQTGVNTVWLYWQPETEAVKNAMVLPSYHVIRIDAAHPSGIDVAGAPILKSSQASSDNPGELVEPLFSFQDASAPVGSVTYKVTMRDAFGRESATPASITITVADWATPAPVGRMKLILSADKLPTVCWKPSSDADAKYRVYRVDPAQMAAQGVNYKPQLVSPDMITGTQILAQMEGRPFQGMLAQRGTAVLQKPSSLKNSVVGRVTPLVKGLENYLSFEDTAAPRDHYYRYIVTSVYARNGLDSEPRLSELIGVPFLTPPPSPTGLTGTFELLPKGHSRPIRNMGRLINLSAVSAAKLVAPVGLGTPNVRTIKTIAPAQSRGTLIQRTATSQSAVKNLIANLPKPDYACNAVISWQPISGPGAPFTYRVYASPVPRPVQPNPPTKQTKFIPLSAAAKSFSSYLKLAPSSGGGPAPSSTPSGNGAPNSPVSKSPLRTSVSALRVSTAAPQVSTASHKYTLSSAVMQQSMVKLGLLNPPTLVTETKLTTVRDGHPGSPISEDIDYTVIPKNQWGIEGPAATIRVHLKPTLAPSIPTLITAGANPTQPDQALLTVIANPDDEEVTKYIVERKTLPQPPKPKSRFSGVTRFGALAMNPVSAKVQTTPSKALPSSRIVKPTQPVHANTVSQTIQAQSVSMEALVSLLESDFQALPDAAITMSASDGMVQLLDTSTKPDTHYAYRVIAVNSSNLQSGRSGYLEAVTHSGTPPAPTLGTPNVTSAGIEIKVNAVSGCQYVLERSQVVNGVDTDFIQILGPTSGPLIDTSVMHGRTYKYRVRAIAALSPPSPPAGPIAVPYP